MNKLSVNQLSEINGGSTATAIAAGVSCVLAVTSPISAMIFGPTCVGTVIGTIYD